MRALRRRNLGAGFTIVELLIVVVVIAILAAITIVAFNGIQNRANDTSVKSDLRNMAMKIREYQALNNSYPKGGTSSSAFPDFGPLAVSRGAYESSVNNVYYCVGVVDGVEQFALAARGKSGMKWAYTNTGEFIEHTGNWGGSGAPCAGAGIPLTAPGFEYKFGVWASNVWNAWIK